MEVETATHELRYHEVVEKRFPIHLFVRGDSYEFWGLWKSNLHLFGVDAPGKLFLFGTDRMGRDMLSRCFYGCRVSLSIGMLGVSLSLFLGSPWGAFRDTVADGPIGDPENHRNNPLLSQYSFLDGAFRGNAPSLASDCKSTS